MICMAEYNFFVMLNLFQHLINWVNLDYTGKILKQVQDDGLSLNCKY